MRTKSPHIWRYLSIFGVVLGILLTGQKFFGGKSLVEDSGNRVSGWETIYTRSSSEKRVRHDALGTFSSRTKILGEILHKISSNDYRDGRSLLNAHKSLLKVESIEEARRMLDMINSSSNDSGVKIMFLAYVMRQAAGVDSDKAWELIGADSGLARNSLLEGYFTGAALNSDQLQIRLSSLDPGMETRCAVAGMLQGIAELPDLNDFDFSVLTTIPPDNRDSLLVKLALRLQLADSSVGQEIKLSRFKEASGKLVGLVQDGLMTQKDLEKFYSDYYPGSPKEALASLVAQAQSTNRPLTESALRSFVKNAATQDPKGTIEKLLGTGMVVVESKTLLFQEAIASWLKVDEKSALEWIRSSSSEIGQDAVDGSNASLAAHQTQRGDLMRLGRRQKEYRALSSGENQKT